MFNYSSDDIFCRLKSVVSISTLAIIIGATTGCNSDNDDLDPVIETPAPQVQAHYVLARVDNGSCSLFDAETGIDLIAGPATTEKGVATFSETPAPIGTFLLECAGGRYIDEATGYVFTGERLRTYVDITEESMVFAATPLTELAVRIVEDNDELLVDDYSRILGNVAVAFGMEEFNLATSVPMDLNVEEADGSAGGRYAVVLAGLSQLQLDTESNYIEDILQLLQFGLANNGQFTQDEIQELYFFALENTFFNPLVDPNLGYDDDLDALFRAVASAPKASQVEYVDAAHDDLTQDGEIVTTIDPYEESTFEIVGTHLFLGMQVTLGEDTCETSDLQFLGETNTDFSYSLMYAHCPARDPGLANLIIEDRGRIENVTEITVGEVARVAKSPKNRMAASANNIVATGQTNFLTGIITAEAPGITPPSAAHSYQAASLEVFPVSGVTVDLINSAGEVVETTFTTADGNYGFVTAPSGDVRVVIKAEVKKERQDGVTSGPDYNFAVRDNTSTTSPKKMYQVTSDAVTIPDGDFNFVDLDIKIKVGFDNDGNSLGNISRQSAPFAILRIVKNAADKLESADANITMPALNIYWSGENIAASGDENLGQIGTSHYAGGGTLPGVFILGKANADTDEFDQGVIGHEFGHYLQDKLSFSDSLGGSHSLTQFKDASVAYGEGYGTAVGGLLSSGPNANYYCDVSGPFQTRGSCLDLSSSSLPGLYGPNGFYAEGSVTYLMYNMGKIDNKGFTAFFNAVTAMKHDVHSATIFAFLDKYVSANPDVQGQVEALMATSNIKSTDPLGTLPAGTPADPAIAPEVNKGTTAQGANLEQIYITYPLASNVAEPGFGEVAAKLAVDNAPTFCINHNLYGADSQNGLGMAKRFLVTPDFTGRLLLRAEDQAGNSLQNSGVYWDIRDDSGAKVGARGYGGPDRAWYYGYINVIAGKEYSIRTHAFYPASILNGNMCGNKLALARASQF